ncbi:hypothetical protein [Klebsiella pneumoniae]|nr:hypothetical protein [Klebsiella pneumoniae]MCY0441072.1 hypothetical protein [Klebsiella pneumoniae]
MDFDFVNYSRRSLLLFVMVASCPHSGEAACWVMYGWHETKLPL